MHAHPSLQFLIPLVFLGTSPLPAETLTPEQIAFFESRIRPVLVDSCYECHSNETGKNKGGLILDTRTGLSQGGNTGPGAVPHNLEDSMLWVAVSYQDPDFEMPPKKKLPASVIADFRQWIEMGAPDPRDDGTPAVVQSEIDIEAGQQFWSFQNPRDTAPPALADPAWAKSEVDRFVLHQLEEAGLEPVGDAGPSALVRRLFFDLIGLPPTPEQARKFYEAWKTDPDRAVTRTIDLLLASPRFGERWGRYWLDVARYGESSGKDVNMSFPHAWRYRDYVIDSFNADKPFNRFIEEQVAGDLLPAKTDAQWQEGLIATGFLAVGTKGLTEQSARQFAMDLADEQIDATTQAFLGLTVACARCHDHKTDPIPTTDYYALAGIFLSTETYFGSVPSVINRNATDLLLLPVADANPTQVATSQLEALKSRLAQLETQEAELRTQAFQARRNQTMNMNSGLDANAFRQLIRLRTMIPAVRSQINGVDENGYAKSFAMGVQDRERTLDANVLVRGEVDKPAQKVTRGFPQVLDHETATIRTGVSGRRELARWLSSPENPLTARVMVNRVWQQLFGQGIVASPNNFGATGREPTHPELLDHLALRFMENGWSVKQLIRELVLTRTYQLSSEFHAANYEQDPDNELLWRASPRRLDAEAIRDSMLAASGQLSLERPRGSLVSEAGDTAIGRRTDASQFNRPVHYRSIYLPIVRDALPESLALFDVADPSLVTGTRDATNVPGQSLYLMNNAFVTELAEAMGDRLMEQFTDPKKRVGHAFLQAYGRPPTPEEIESCITFFRTFMPAAAQETGNRAETEKLAMTAFCQALFSSAEFRYLN